MVTDECKLKNCTFIGASLKEKVSFIIWAFYESDRTFMGVIEKRRMNEAPKSGTLLYIKQGLQNVTKP
jgi:hypothetical protein